MAAEVCYKSRLRCEQLELHEPEIVVTVANGVGWKWCAMARASEDGDGGVIGVGVDDDVVGVNMRSTVGDVVEMKRKIKGKEGKMVFWSVRVSDEVRVFDVRGA